MTTTDVPTNPYQAGNWLAARHPWLRELAERICGNLDTHEDWLEQLPQAVNDADANETAWSEYKKRYPAPRDDTAYDDWLNAGPKTTGGAKAFGVMSSGEKRLVRLVATIHGRVAWSVQDISFDQRGAAILADWLQIVRAQLPEWMYPSNEATDAALAEVARNDPGYLDYIAERRQDES